MELEKLDITINGVRFRLVPDGNEVTPPAEKAIARQPQTVETPEQPKRPARLQRMMEHSAPQHPSLEDLIEACRVAVSQANGDKDIYLKTKKLIALYTPTGDGVAKDVPPERRNELINDIKNVLTHNHA